MNIIITFKNYATIKSKNLLDNKVKILINRSILFKSSDHYTNLKEINTRIYIVSRKKILLQFQEIKSYFSSILRLL